MQGMLGPSLVFKFIGGMFSAAQQSRAANQQESLMRTRLAQQKAAAADRAATRATKLNRLISQSAVAAQAQGMANSSGFQQVLQQDFDVFHEDTDADRLNLSMQETSIKSEMAGIEAQKEAGFLKAFTPFASGTATNVLDMYGLGDKGGSDSFFGGF